MNTFGSPKRYQMDVLLSSDYRYRSFLGTCSCGISQELTPGDFTINEEDPLHYPCSCGEGGKILRNRRRCRRTKVGLAGRVVLSSDLWKADWFGTVLDISTGGMLIETDPIRNIFSNESVGATILLEDKTKLEMPGRIRRLLSSSDSLLMGIEFGRLTTLQHYILDFQQA